LSTGSRNGVSDSAAAEQGGRLVRILFLASKYPAYAAEDETIADTSAIIFILRLNLK
jgi:hypothetical protein